MTAGESNAETLALAKGAGISLVGRGLSRGLLLLGMAILTRALSWEQFGLFSLGWTVLQIGSALGPGGLAQGVIHFGTLYWKKDEARLAGMLWQSLALASGVAALTAIILYLLSDPIADWFQKPGLDLVLKWISFALACVIVLRVAAASTRITRRMQFSALAEDLLPAAVFALGGYLFTMVLAWELAGGLLALLLGFVLGLVLSIWGVFHFFPEFRHWVFGKWGAENADGRGLFVFLRVFRARSILSWKELAAFSLPSSLATILGTITLLAPRFIAGYYLPGEDIGRFQAAFQLATLTSIILTSFNAIFAPLVSALHREDRQRLNEVYKVGTKWGLYASLPFFIVMILLPAPLLRFVFGEATPASVTAFVILTGAQIVNTATGGIGTVLVMSGYQKNWMTISLGTFAAAVIASILMLPAWGLTGLAVATAIGIVGMFVWALFEGRRVLRVWPYDRRYWKGLAAGFCALAAAWVYAAFGRGSDLLVLVIAGLIACGVFALSLLLLGLDAEDVGFLQAVKERVTVQSSTGDERR